MGFFLIRNELRNGYCKPHGRKMWYQRLRKGYWFWLVLRILCEYWRAVYGQMAFVYSTTMDLPINEYSQMILYWLIQLLKAKTTFHIYILRLLSSIFRAKLFFCVLLLFQCLCKSARIGVCMFILLYVIE